MLGWSELTDVSHRPLRTYEYERKFQKQGIKSPCDNNLGGTSPRRR